MIKKQVIGIYKITSPSGKVYIGQSWDIYKRWSHYKCKNDKSRQLHLTASLLKYGWPAHAFEVLHELPPDVEQKIMDDYEQLYMDQYRSVGIVLMNCREAGSAGKLSEAHRKRIALSQTGAKRPQSTKDKIAYANTQRTLSDEAKKKIGDANRGRVHTDEHKKKVKDALTGKPKPEGHGAAVSAALSGVEKTRAHREALSASRINSGVARGANNPKAKLDENKVRVIKKRLAAGERQVDIAKDYGVNRGAICDIANGKKWIHVV